MADEHTVRVGGANVRIRPLAGDEEARACARIMSGSEPWMSLGRDYDASLAVVRDSGYETYVAISGNPGDVVGFVILTMRGAFVGYVRSVAVRDDWRSRGLGAELMAFAETRIFRESPNVFICVSAFNHRARAFYERLGYEAVGELRDYILAGHSEWLLRKTMGALRDFTSSR